MPANEPVEAVPMPANEPVELEPADKEEGGATSARRIIAIVTTAIRRQVPDSDQGIKLFSHHTALASCNNNNNNGFRVSFGVRRCHRGPPFTLGYHQFIIIVAIQDEGETQCA